MPRFEPLFAALNAAGARYVVVGGVATVLHGYPRLTVDVDLIVDFEPAETQKVMEVLTSLAYQPLAPVAAETFADPRQRAAWRAGKGMQVFSLWNREDPLLTVDLFVEHPIDFGELWERSEIVSLRGTTVRIAALADLIRLKRLAGRPQDLEDIRQLEEIQHLRGRTRE